MLTESEIQKSWRRLFAKTPVEEGGFEKAEELIEQLRSESPLRVRLAAELDEVRKMSEAKVS